MVALIKDNMAAIQELCKRHYVRSLYVFGSAINELHFSMQSDVDFLYDIDINSFANWATSDYDYIDNLNDFETDLNKLLLRKVDLVPYNNIHNRYFKEVVDTSRQLIYGDQ